MVYETLYEEYDLEYINDKFSLREPQYESLLVLDKIIKESDLLKEYELQDLLKQIHEMYPTLASFEREFPSICFALATGVGKTRLMAAFITYLYTNYGIKHFFVLAPNLTIYNKLIRDFDDPSYSKYLFRGIDIFEQKPPRVVTGDTYKESFAGQQSIEQSIEINVFNISKINSETRGGNLPQIKRLSEFIGQSYFDYLSSLDDLVLIMDESHHYRADRGMTVINELKPLFGLELTATPQVERAAKTIKFKNVVYEYSLAKAIVDGFVKEPTVATRVDFDPKKFQAFEIDRFKLIDGLRIHRITKAELELYAKVENKRLVKPFVLVVCRDTTHAAEVKSYIESDEFFHKYYDGKVIEVHSNQSGNEKDENVQKLLQLEDENNEIEIVIHVNMLKEGWDVTNLYTIIPLRTATSTTLREQTIGRGLRLPYGEKTNNDSVNRLTIVVHDKFKEIIDAANDEGSIIKQGNIINISEIEDFDKEKEIFSNKSITEQYFTEKQFELDEITDVDAKKDAQENIAIEKAISEVIEDIVHKTKRVENEFVHKSDNSGRSSFANFSPFTSNNKEQEINEIKIEPIIITKTTDLNNTQIMESVTNQVVQKLNKQSQISLFDENASLIIEKVKQHYSAVAEQKINSTIDIPDIAMIPINEVTYIYKDFELDMAELNFSTVSEDIIIESLKDSKSSLLKGFYNSDENESIEDLIIGELLSHEEINYKACKDKLYMLITQVINHYKRSYDEKEIENIFKYHKHDIANEIFRQMMFKNHFVIEPPKFETKLINAVSPILKHNYSKYKEDEILNYTTTVPASEIKKKVFGGFKKACHTEYKFDSEPEHVFAFILERDDLAKKWLRPAPKQFKIWWRGGQNYEPDFLFETKNKIYLVEIKGENRIDDEDVLLKAKAAYAFCNNINNMNLGGKEWDYMLITDSDVKRNSTIEYFIKEIEMHAYNK